MTTLKNNKAFKHTKNHTHRTKAEIMSVKFILALLMFGTVCAGHGNNIYLPLVRLESNSGEQTGFESDSDIKEYIGEVFVNISNLLDGKYEINGTELATKEDILTLNRKLDNILAFVREQRKPRPTDCDDIMKNGNNATGIYTIFPVLMTTPISVRCDMDTSEGG